jgi:hypothetical protein
VKLCSIEKLVGLFSFTTVRVPSLCALNASIVCGLRQAGPLQIHGGILRRRQPRGADAGDDAVCRRVSRLKTVIRPGFPMRGTCKVRPARLCSATLPRYSLGTLTQVSCSADL